MVESESKLIHKIWTAVKGKGNLKTIANTINIISVKHSNVFQINFFCTFWSYCEKKSDKITAIILEEHFF